MHYCKANQCAEYFQSPTILSEGQKNPGGSHYLWEAQYSFTSCKTCSPSVSSIVFSVCVCVCVLATTLRQYKPVVSLFDSSTHHILVRAEGYQRS